MDRIRLRELLDVCRPESADQAQPEMGDVRAALERDAMLRGRAKRAEQFDRQVAAAVHDVEIPIGLRERLLASLVAAKSDAQPDDCPSDRSRSEAPRVEGRRRLPAYLVGAVLSAAAAVLAMLTYQWFVGGDNWTPRAIAEESVHRFADDFDPRQPSQWTIGKAPRADYPLSQHLVHGVKPPQRVIRNLSGCSGVAYQLRSRAGAVASLVVLKPRSTLADFPAKPPKAPQVDTAGCAAATWREKGRLYVLVVAGGADKYREFLRGPSRVAMSQIPAGKAQRVVQ